MNKFEDLQNKSWVELCDDEDEPIRRSRRRTRSRGTNQNSDPRASDDDSLSSNHNLSRTTPEKKHSVPNNFASYANILKSSSPDVINNSDSVLRDRSASHSKSDAKREIQKDFLQDDISLSSHLDVFHMASPCKGNPDSKPQVNAINSNTVNDEEFPKIDDWPRRVSFKNRVTPTKKEDEHPKRYSARLNKEHNANRNGEAEGADNENPERVVKRRFQSRNSIKKSILPDDILMPSPSKMIRQFGNVENSPGACKTPKNDGRKRQREALSSPASGGSRKSSQKFENDPAVLERRQKQIDYGKNTIGYERYVELVPRNERHKNHPQTPPRHIQYSRRAWDGLIKIWRRRLHFWDPPSEGGGDPALLEDDGDLSSCDNRSQCTSSIPSTPQQESKRRKARENDFSEEIVKDVDEDCKPLPVEDWLLAMSSDEDVDTEEDHKFD